MVFGSRVVVWEGGIGFRVCRVVRICWRIGGGMCEEEDWRNF